MTLHGDILGERARLTPAKLALIDTTSGVRLTYEELDARATTCAAILRHQFHLCKGDRFGILAGNRIEYLDFFFAAGKTGAIVVPLGTRLTAHELQHIIADSGMRLLVYDASCAATVKELRQIAAVPQCVSLDPNGPDTACYDDLREIEITADRPFVRERCESEDLYALLYTSGTTGRPKGVMIPHRMITWNAYNTVMSWQLRDDDVSPIFTPLYHAGALNVFLTPLVAIGGTLVLHQAFDAVAVWQTIVGERCTVVLGVPTIWKLLMEAPAFRTADLSHVRAFISGGAPLPEYIAQAYQDRGVVFKQGYGLTEVGVNCFSMTVEESVRKRGSVGKPMMMTEAMLVDEHRQPVAVGEVGELLLRGPHVCRGYWHNADATAQALDADGWFHTGDLARRDAEGFFTIAGRRKDMLISGGVNIYPAEIEGELLQHPAIADAAVVGVPHETWGEVGVAFLVLRGAAGVASTTGSDAAMPSSAELVAFLEPRLARYKIPKTFVTIDALPRTAYGKVQKPLLQEQYTRGQVPTLA